MKCRAEMISGRDLSWWRRFHPLVRQVAEMENGRLCVARLL